MDKDWGVLITRDGKRVLKQYSDRDELDDFCEKLKKFDSIQFEIIERQASGQAGRETSPAFVRVEARNLPEGHYYKCIPVRPHKGHLFCTECHDYRKFVKRVFEYGLEMKVCPYCQTSSTDYYVKIANGLPF